MLFAVPEDQPQPDGEIKLPKPKQSAAPCVIFLVVCMALFAFLFYSYLSRQVNPSSGGTAAPIAQRTPALKHAEYWVYGNLGGSANVTYSNESGGTEQNTVRFPWILEMKVPAGRFLYLSAQKTEERGTVRAAISVEGKIVQEANSSAAFGIASVSGSVPR